MTYQPTAVPNDAPRGLKSWLARQLRLVADELAAPSVRQLWLQPLGVEPERPSDGILVYANGSTWDPGGGAGVYAREGGSWVKL